MTAGTRRRVDTAALVSLVAEQCPELDLAGTETAKVQAGLSSPKTTATIVYRPNRGEIERRQVIGLAGVTRLDQLDLMMSLPAGLPVSLEARDRRKVNKLPSGCVDITADGVVRQLVKPLNVRLAIVTGHQHQWKPGLVRAGRFGAYCTRLLALPGKPPSLAEKAVEADFWGIGLVVNAATEPELVVAPAKFEPFRHTPASWAFAEAIYSQIAVHRGLES